MKNNILLQKFTTPFETVPFNEIKNEMFLPAIKAAIVNSKNKIEKIKAEIEPQFENIIVALEEAGEEVEKISGIFFNLNSAETNDEIQALAKDISPILTEYSNDITLDEKLFTQVKKIWDMKNELKLSVEEDMLLTKTYKGFVRNGANLSIEDKEKLREISKKLSTLSLEFSEHLLKETQRFMLVIENKDDLIGLPEDVCEMAAMTAKLKNLEGKWVFTLDFPSLVPFMTYSKKRELRHQMYLANSSRCYKNDDLDNQKIVLEIAELRFLRAQLLGYKSHADFVLEERMAQNPQTVFDFLNNLLEHATKAAQKETEELKIYAQKLDQITDFQKWDLMYYSEKLKTEKFQINDEMLKPYFKLEKVIDGVFQVANKLYGLTFKENKSIPIYHQDVMTYEVLDENNQHMAVFYADFHPREGKRNGAWMTSFRGQKKTNGQNIRPHISIVCNFTRPTETKPSLLTFNEVQTLFHEFGHALHGMLANTRFESLSGTNVYWDFVELPSQILENWAFEKECLDLFAEHFETREKIPAQLIQNLKDSSSFLEARGTLRQCSFAMIDMKWHAANPNAFASIEACEVEVARKTDFLPMVNGTSVSSAFAHIFAGGYSAGYYSYKWAEVLDADAFEYFKEKGIFSKEVATKFKSTVLSQGGSIHPMDLYIQFRGKKPNPDALLRRSGLI